MQELPSLEHLLTEFISLGQEDVERSFKRGEIGYYILQMGCSAKQLASMANCSAELIRVLTKTYEAFPVEDERVYDELSFYHYRLAARTKDPHYWMNKATECQWSTRELSKAIKVEPTPDEYREAETLLFKVKRMLNDDNVGEWFKDKLSSLMVKHAFDKEDDDLSITGG